MGLTLLILTVFCSIRIAPVFGQQLPNDHRIYLRNSEGGAIIGWPFTLNGQVYGMFKKIPYARAPVRNLRLTDPQPLPWNFSIDTSNGVYSKMCPQNNPDPSATSEDCLYLNIFTPAASNTGMPGSSSSYPVLFWIHGGGFEMGSASRYTEEGIFRNLVQNGVAVVTINYRLGPLGYLTFYSTGADGNYGLKDQIMALQWVKKYIDVFGGNPNQITVGGGSAGAGSTSLMALIPQSSRLFQRAIMMSGAAAFNDVKGITKWSKNAPLSPAQKQKDTSSLLAMALGCMNRTGGSNIQNNFGRQNRQQVVVENQQVLNCIRQKPLQQIMQASGRIKQNPPGSMVPYPPVWPFPTDFKTDRRRLITQSGVTQYLIGSTSDEWGMFAYSNFPEPQRPPTSEAALKQEIDNVYRSGGLNTQLIKNQYVDRPLRRAQMTDPSSIGPQFFANQTIKMRTAQVFHAPVYAEAEEYANGGPKTVYLYDFGYVPAAALPSIPEWKGAVHGSDSAFVMGLKDPSTYNIMEKALDPSYLTQQDRQVESLMGTLWTNFIKTGLPSPFWRPLVVGQANYMQINGPQPTMKNGYYQQDVAFWKNMNGTLC